MNITPEIRYELKRLVIISSLVIFALILFMLRGNLIGYRVYRFMLWNLFLALIPYVISLIMLVISSYNNKKVTTPLCESNLLANKNNKWWNLCLLFLGGFWLLFFPNAPYLFTSYAHFSEMTFWTRPISFTFQPWYDLVLYSGIIWSGILAGYVSLEIIHTIVKKHFGKLIGWVIIIIILFLSSWAIYLGRFIRLNSWDIFTNPSILLPHILLNREQLFFVFILGLFMLLVYLFLQVKRDMLK